MCNSDPLTDSIVGLDTARLAIECPTYIIVSLTRRTVLVSKRVLHRHTAPGNVWQFDLSVLRLAVLRDISALL